MSRGFGSFVLILLAMRPAFAETRWTMVRTPDLAVVGDQSASTLRKVAIEIEQFRAVVGGLFPKAERPLALPTTVFVFGQRDAARPFMPLGAGGKPAEIAGYFSRSQDMQAILMTLEGFEEAGAIIYHEYTHLLIGSAVRSVPVWLNEGLAEYYSTYALTNGGRSADIGRPISRHIAVLRERYTPLAELIAVDRTSDLFNEGKRQSIFYAQSWALVHYLLSEMTDGRSAINRYAAAIAAGRSPNDAFRDAFAQTPAEFDRQLRAYVRRMTFAGQRFTFDEKIAAPVVSDPVVLDNAEASARLGDLQRRIGRHDEAARRIQAAVQSNPASAAGQLAFGLLRIDEDRDAEGLEALKRAAELNADDFTLQFTRGIWLLRTREREPSAERAQAARDAIAPLRRATQLKADSAEAFAWLAYAQMQEMATLGDARAAIDRALELAPGDATFRIRRADIIGLQGQYEDAKTALREIAAATSDPVASDAASVSLDSLERRHRDAAAEPADAAAPRGLPGSSAQIVDDGRAQPALRKLGPGERREWGFLVGIDCAPAEVRFEIRGGARTVVAVAPRMENVELISYLDEKDFTISCGRRPRPDSVLITWTPQDDAAAARDGAAVALEFLPKGYRP